MNILGMFARLPAPGKTKTRLAASVGNEAAAELYAAFVEDLADRCDKVADQFWIAITPDTSRSFDWFEDIASYDACIIPQPEGDLGTRISWFFDEARQQGGQRIVLIGSDSPDLPSGIVNSAFDRLSESDVVIAPASDGGFVLIGLRCSAGDLFTDIKWSSATTLTDTIANAESRNLTVELLQPWYDVDTIESLGNLIALQKSRGASNEICPRTDAVLDKLAAEIQAALAES